jgi:ribosome-associated translation inhibitor RaiA
VIALDIDAHGHHLSTELEQRIEGWIGKLDEFMARIDRGHVAVTQEGGRKELTTVRVQLWGPGRHFEASNTDRDAIKAVDRTRHALESQLRRAHDKELSSRHR